MQSHAPLVRSSDRIEGGLSVIYTVTDGEVLTPKAFLHLLRAMLRSVVQQRWVAFHLSLNHWLRPSSRDSL